MRKLAYVLARVFRRGPAIIENSLARFTDMLKELDAGLELIGLAKANNHDAREAARRQHLAEMELLAEEFQRLKSAEVRGRALHTQIQQFLGAE